MSGRAQSRLQRAREFGPRTRSDDPLLTFATLRGTPALAEHRVAGLLMSRAAPDGSHRGLSGRWT